MYELATAQVYRSVTTSVSQLSTNIVASHLCHEASTCNVITLRPWADSAQVGGRFYLLLGSLVISQGSYKCIFMSMSCSCLCHRQCVSLICHILYISHYRYGKTMNFCKTFTLQILWLKKLQHRTCIHISLAWPISYMVKHGHFQCGCNYSDPAALTFLAPLEICGHMLGSSIMTILFVCQYPWPWYDHSCLVTIEISHKFGHVWNRSTLLRHSDNCALSQNGLMVGCLLSSHCQQL